MEGKYYYVRVRRAMQMALDLETMNDTYFKGTARWKPRGLLGDAILGYTTPLEEWPEEVRKGYTYDRFRLCTIGCLLLAGHWRRRRDYQIGSCHTWSPFT